MRSVAMTRNAGHAGRQRRPDEPADGEPDARERRPRPARGCRCPPTGVDDVAALRARRAIPMSAAIDDASRRRSRPGRRARCAPPSWRATAASTGRPRAAAGPRRSPSPPGTTRPASPMMNEPKLKNVSWSTRRRLGQVEARDRSPRSARRSAAATPIISLNASAEATISTPYSADARGPTRSRCRPGRPAAA